MVPSLPPAVLWIVSIYEENPTRKKIFFNYELRLTAWYFKFMAEPQWFPKIWLTKTWFPSKDQRCWSKKNRSVTRCLVTFHFSMFCQKICRSSDLEVFKKKMSSKNFVKKFKNQWIHFSAKLQNNPIHNNICTT